MSWMSILDSRLATAEQAAAVVRSGMRVFLTGNCSVPQTVLAALIGRAQEVRDVEIVQVLTFGGLNLASPELAGHLRVNTLFISEDIRAAVNDGRADFTPAHLSEIPRLFSSGALPVDVALIQVSPPDEHGFCSFGVEVGVTKTAAQHARLVIAEINPNMPRTLGDSFIHVSKFAHAVMVDYPLPEISMGSTTEISSRIGANAAGLIED